MTLIDGTTFASLANSFRDELEQYLLYYDKGEVRPQSGR